MSALLHPVVHLELHTDDLSGARAAYTELCGWRSEQVQTQSGEYLALGLGEHFGGGIVECGTSRPMWLPYVRVDEIGAAAARARDFGATVLLEPREGPTGWRTVVSVPAGGEIAFWQPRGWIA
jgi:predicted enzyme related to lactoylglutathione lyase